MSSRGSRAVLLALLLAGCSDPTPSLDAVLSEATFVDLTHTFDSTTVYWPTEEGFVLERGFEGITDKGYYYAAHRFKAAEHGGTHLDAPIHFSESRWTNDEIPLANLIGPAIVVDVTDSVAAERTYQVAVADLLAWEAEHGRIRDGAIVLIRSGLSYNWPDRESYLGTAERGPEAVAHLRFPGLAPEAARWLVENRTVASVGIDTPSIDFGQSTHYESHQVLFGANVPAFENLANLERLPAAGAWVFALPMKIGGGSGAPLRIVAVLGNPHTP